MFYNLGLVFKNKFWEHIFLDKCYILFRKHGHCFDFLFYEAFELTKYPFFPKLEMTLVTGTTTSLALEYTLDDEY